jgi:mannose-6-phosphate isomerase-like protein (cupin superfamily)
MKRPIVSPDDQADWTTEDSELLGELLAVHKPWPLRASLRERLIESTRQTSRFEAFVGEVGRLLDIGLDAARTLLWGVDDPSSWVSAPMPGVALFHVAGGPAVAGAITGFVRVEPGQAFPEHGHLGNESVLIIQGSARLVGGEVVGPGTLVEADDTVVHDVHAEGENPLIYLAVVFGGVRVGEHVFSPTDPDM